MLVVPSQSDIILQTSMKLSFSINSTRSLRCVCVCVMCTVSIPNAFIWSALFSAMVKNFFGSDRASTIAETHKTICQYSIEKREDSMINLVGRRIVPC